MGFCVNIETCVRGTLCELENLKVLIELTREHERILLEDFSAGIVEQWILKSCHIHISPHLCVGF